MKDLRSHMCFANIHQIIIDIAEALVFIHTRDFIHADLKPANILIRSTGKAVLADLGAGFYLKVSNQKLFPSPICEI